MSDIKFMHLFCLLIFYHRVKPSHDQKGRTQTVIFEVPVLQLCIIRKVYNYIYSLFDNKEHRFKPKNQIRENIKRLNQV